MDNFYSQANSLTRFGPARDDKPARGCKEMPTSRPQVLWERISSLGVDKLRALDSGSPPTPDQVNQHGQEQYLQSTTLQISLRLRQH
jgi:hypothetical protein